MSRYDSERVTYREHARQLRGKEAQQAARTAWLQQRAVLFCIHMLNKYKSNAGAGCAKAGPVCYAPCAPGMRQSHTGKSAHSLMPVVSITGGGRVR
eukprot:7391768-Prymnesium_polylepis.2